MGIWRIPALVALAAMRVSAQTSAHPITNGGNGPVGGSSAIGLASPGGTSSSSTTRVAATRGTLFYGKVAMADGSAPPSQVAIERVCSGAALVQGFTDSKGNFSFDPGLAPDAVADAAVGGAAPGSPQSSPSSPLNCDLRASLAGYRSDVVSLSDRRDLDEPNLGTIVLHRLQNAEGLTISAVSALAPKDARKAFEKGVDALKKSRLDDAQQNLRKAVELFPRYAAAWFELGLCLEQQAHLADARDAYAKAIAADSKFIKPYERLYVLSAREQNWEDVAAITGRIMRLNRYDFPEAIYYNALANLKLDRLDLAEKSAREEAAARNPKINYLLGVILVKKHDLKGAAECLRAYLKVESAPDRGQVTLMLAEIEKQIPVSN